MLDIHQFDESVLGKETSDPLHFAFADKTSAHAAGGARPIAREQYGARLNALYAPHHSSTLDAQAAIRVKQRCLYIHIPFCRVRCTFCNFFQNAASRQWVDEYFAALMREIEQKAALPWTQSGVFQAVYIGGGTPTDLSPQQVRQLGQALAAHFPLAKDCELTLEGRINRFSDEMFDNALEGGFNRFSFGIQSFNTQVRRSAKRLDDREVVLERIGQLSATEQAPIILDLLYGLPYQSLEVFEQDLQDYLASGAHGIDLYQLVVGGSAPMINLVDKGKIPPPATTPLKADMYQLGSEFMAKHHQRPLSVNHWARDNRERSLYNSLAKTYAEVLPIGCGAGGNIAGVSMMNHRTLATYMEAMNTGQPVVAMMMEQHPLEPLFATLKAGFDRGVISREALESANAQCALHSDVPRRFDFAFLQPLFEVWQARGLANVEEDYLHLTLAGRFWSVSLAQAAIKVLQFYYQPASMSPHHVGSIA